MSADLRNISADITSSDVLPGESSGDDINDDISQLGDRAGHLIQN